MEKPSFSEFEDWEREDPNALYYLATGTKPSELGPDPEWRSAVSKQIDAVFLHLTAEKQNAAAFFLEKLMIERRLIAENGSEDFGPYAKHAVLMQKLITSRNMLEPLKLYVQYLTGFIQI